jgi:hypothetical protein
MVAFASASLHAGDHGRTRGLAARGDDLIVGRGGSGADQVEKDGCAYPMGGNFSPKSNACAWLLSPLSWACREG